MSEPAPDPTDRFRGPWFDSKTAALYVCCKNVRAFYEWRKRHGIVARANGSVAKADLDRALKVKRATRRGQHPHSVASRFRKAAPTPEHTPAEDMGFVAEER